MAVYYLVEQMQVFCSPVLARRRKNSILYWTCLGCFISSSLEYKVRKKMLN